MNVDNNTRIILKELKDSLIQGFGENINSVILFGSRSTGLANENSDYDIVVILKNDYDRTYEKQLIKTVYQFELEKDVLTDIHLISVNQMNNTLKGKDPLFVNAIKNGIHA
jgi:predicted nucleotidyltransferase